MTKVIQNYEFRTDLFYDPVNQYWVDIKNGIARIGLNPLVQETSGSFVAVQFNAEQKQFNRGESVGSLEAEKHVSHIKTPLTGKIVKTNDQLLENPRLLNDDPYGSGWLLELELTNEDEEMKYLLQDEDEVVIWFENEIKKHEDKGWIAQ
jgi:glycine cleavage system H protein